MPASAGKLPAHKRVLCTLLAALLLAHTAAATCAQSGIAADSAHTHKGGGSLRQAPRRSRPLWPGSRFTESDRDRAVMRGLSFIYRTSRVGRNFEEYGPDYLWCFYTLSVAVRDPRVRAAASRMGLERARLWRSKHTRVPADADAGTVSELAYGDDAAASLGLGDEELRSQLRRTALFFKPKDFLLFDPASEGPPGDVPDKCERCGADNPRGQKLCFVCKTPLVMRTRYDVWYDALITAYVGERAGVRLGASYADVLKWLPTLRPYRARAGDPGEEFHDTIYAITHVVYTLNNYSQLRLSPRLLPLEFEFLKEGLAAAVEDGDDDMLGETMDTLRALGLTTRDPLMRRGMEYYLTHQNPDGSWGDRSQKDIYKRYHPTWNAVAGLCEYSWAKGEGLSFPELGPMLEKWAEEDAVKLRVTSFEFRVERKARHSKLEKRNSKLITAFLPAGASVAGWSGSSAQGIRPRRP